MRNIGSRLAPVNCVNRASDDVLTRARGPNEMRGRPRMLTRFRLLGGAAITAFLMAVPAQAAKNGAFDFTGTPSGQGGSSFGAVNLNTADKAVSVADVRHTAFPEPATMMLLGTG